MKYLILALLVLTIGCEVKNNYDKPAIDSADNYYVNEEYRNEQVFKDKDTIDDTSLVTIYGTDGPVFVNADYCQRFDDETWVCE